MWILLILVTVFGCWVVAALTKKYVIDKLTEKVEYGGYGKMNKYDAYKKCEKIVTSCKTYRQWLTAMEIPYLHYKMYKDGFLESALISAHTYAEPKELETEEDD